MFRLSSKLLGAATAGASATAAAAFVFQNRPGAAAKLDAPAEPKEINMKAFTFCEVLKTRTSSTGAEGKTGATKRITFGCKCSHQPISMVFVRATAEQHGQGEKPVTKFYNPVATTDSSFDIEVKLYPEGKVSGSLHNAKAGDVFQVKGPARQFKYATGQFKKMAFVIGGTGITPSYQLIKSVVEDSADDTPITLIFANKTKTSVPLLSELMSLQAAHKSQLEVHFLVDEEEDVGDTMRSVGWRNGRVDKDSLAELLPAPTAEGLKIFVCGPGSMAKAVSGSKVFGKGPPQQGPLTGALADLGYSAEQVHKI